MQWGERESLAMQSSYYLPFLYGVGQWEQVQRPEIVRLFEDNVYEQVPKDFDGICIRKKHEDKEALECSATLKKVDVEVTRDGQSITIHPLFFVPNQAKKPVSAFVVINHRGMETMDVTVLPRMTFGRRKR